MCLNYFLWLYSLLFDTFLNHQFMAHFQWHHFVTILSQLSILSPFCHHFVTILSQFTMRRRKLYSDDKLNRAIGEYYNGTKKVIAVTESMNVCLNSVESSFQMIINVCEFAVPALYQLVKNLVFLLKTMFLYFRIYQLV